MHSYDVEGRGRVVVALTTGSFLLVWLLHVGLAAINFSPEWWLSVPSFAGVYSVMHWLFDRHLWRSGFLRKLGLLIVPDLNGTWRGEVNSSYGSEGSTASVSAKIMQRWTKLSIALETAHSRSRSFSASFRTENVPRPEIFYMYINEPKGRAPETMQMHRGTVSLELTGESLEGDYYTGRGRREIGTLKLTRVSQGS